MRKIVYLIGFFILLILLGCGKDKPASSNEMRPPDDVVEQLVESESLSYDNVVKPIGKTIQGQLYVENSEPVNPFVKINLINSSQSPQQVIVSDAVAQEVRWKVRGPFMPPKYPASGFVTLNLTKNQWDALEGKDIIIKKAISK